MADVTKIPDALIDPPRPGIFQTAFADENNLIFFVLNVGDGDTQLIVLPRVKNRPRRALVVDIANANSKKLSKLIRVLVERQLLQPTIGQSRQPGADQSAHVRAMPIVVATHPHDDHIGGMAGFIREFQDDIGEFWEPGYYHPTASFIEMMRAIEDNPQIVLSQPAAGLRRFIDGVRITVLSPSIQLKNRYDSYGVEINNSSITLKLEYPYSRVAARELRVSSEATRGPDARDRVYKKIKRVRSIILGGDAQTVAWGQVINDFPRLDANTSPAFKALKMARGVEPLRADVLKVPHHASKHGINIELVEHIHPEYAIVSSVAHGGRYNFPHEVALESIREAVQSTTSKQTERKADYELGLRFTSDQTEGEVELGSIAVVIPPSSGSIAIWRFCDARDEFVDLDKARRHSASSG